MPSWKALAGGVPRATPTRGAQILQRSQTARPPHPQVRAGARTSRGRAPMGVPRRTGYPDSGRLRAAHSVEAALVESVTGSLAGPVLDLLTLRLNHRAEEAA